MFRLYETAFLNFIMMNKIQMISQDEALPGRDTKMPVANRHYVSGHGMQPPFPDGFEQVILGMGCFWGAERQFWSLSGVYTTAVGYAGGYTPNPSYQEVCTGMTGHNEVVLVVWDPGKIRFEQILAIFWQSHDPTQGMRQGNDVGTQYRSGIYYDHAKQHAQAKASKSIYETALQKTVNTSITTEILPVSTFYYAEDYHQQYLAKNPGGYCGLGGVGVDFPKQTSG